MCLFIFQIFSTYPPFMFGQQYYANSIGKMPVTHSLNETLAAGLSVIVNDQLNSTCEDNFISNKPQTIFKHCF